MEYEIRQIHLSVEKLGLPDINYGEENTDVIVEMTDGNLYAASFYSYGNLDKVIARHRASGEFLDGKLNGTLLFSSRVLKRGNMAVILSQVSM